MENIMKFLTPKSKTAYIENDSTVRQAIEKMRHHGYAALPVIDGQGLYIGTLTEGDFLWHMVDLKTADLYELEGEPIAKLLRADWNPPVRADATMTDLVEKVKERNFAPVVDDRGVFIGLITRRDVLSYFARCAEGMAQKEKAL